MDFTTEPAIPLIIKQSNFGRFKREKKTIRYLLARSNIDVQCVSDTVTIYFNHIVLADMAPSPIPILIHPKNSKIRISITLPEFKSALFADSEITKDQLINFFDNDTVRQINITELFGGVCIDLISRCNIQYSINLRDSVISIDNMEVNNDEDIQKN